MKTGGFIVTVTRVHEGLEGKERNNTNICLTSSQFALACVRSSQFALACALFVRMWCEFAGTYLCVDCGKTCSSKPRLLLHRAVNHIVPFLRAIASEFLVLQVVDSMPIDRATFTKRASFCQRLFLFRVFVLKS